METNKAEETPLKKMNSDRIKEIQETTSCPNSTSVQQALLQVWNECSQQSQSEIDELTKEVEELIESKQSYCQQYEDKCKEVERLRNAMQLFCDRVDKGEVRSTKTYNQFKELLTTH